MALDFTAIDFETANGNAASACAVGLVKVRDGLVVDRFSTLIRPTAPYDEFDPAFGIDSARAHEVAGGLAVRGDLATLRRDVDDLDDLHAAALLGLGAETSRAASGLL